MASEKLSIILELITGNYKREAREASVATGQIGDSATTSTNKLSKLIGPVAIGGLIVGLGRMGAAAIASASQLEQSIGGVESVFGDVSDQIHEFGETSAQAVGLATSEFNNLALLTGALLKNMGLPLEETADKTLVLTERAADLAATFGGPVSSAVEAINSALKGEANPIEAYGIKLNAAAVEARVLADNTGLLKREITDAHKAQAIYNIILDQSADSAGQFGRESETAAGQQERLRAELENTKAEIGQRLLPVMVSLMKTARDLVPILEDVADELVSVVEEVAPLVDQVATLGGWILRLRGETDDLSESENIFAEAAGGAFDVLEAGLKGPVGLLMSAYDELQTLLNDGVVPAFDAETLAAQEAAFATRDLEGVTRGAVTTNSAFILSLDDERGALDHTTTSVDLLRQAEVRLADERIANLSPALAALQAIEDSATAYDDLRIAQEDGKSTQSELTQLQIEAAIAAETARIRIAEFGVVGEESMAAFATATGISVEAARLLYAQLGLLVNQPWNIKVTTSWPGKLGGLQEFAGGGVVQGVGPQLIIAHGGEIVSKPGQSVTNNKTGPTIIVNNPIPNHLVRDLQYASLISNLESLVS